MTHGHLSILLNEANFSPEQLGERLGIAGRTVRRWAELPQDEPLPPLYEKAVHETVYELLAEGRLSPESETAKTVLSESKNNPIFAALKGLGIDFDFLKKSDQSPDSIVEGVMQIGASDKKQQSVDRSKKRVFSYRKLGREWKYRIETLWKVISSTELTRFEKFVAYGALFYLISPFDLIPDHIPVFGLMDDYLILGLAVGFYLRRFPHLFKKPETSEE